MDSSDEEVLLESCCLVVIIRSKSKEKGKERGCGKYLKKRTEQGVCHNLMQEMRVNDRESHFRLFV